MGFHLQEMDFSILNLIWTLLTLMGFLAACLASKECWLDYKIANSFNGDKTFQVAVARMALITQLAIAFTLFFFLTLGIIAIFISPVDDIFIVILFMASATILTVASIASNMFRKYIVSLGGEGPS